MKRNMKQLYQSVVITVLLVGQIVIQSGLPWGGVMAKANPNRTDQPSWEPLAIPFNEDKGYALYTYVLFGKKLNLMGGVEKRTLERYESLLSAIGESNGSDGRNRVLDKKASHIFMMPLSGQMEALKLNTYSDMVSMRYLSLANAMLKDSAPALTHRLTTGEGPFLITVPKPLKDAHELGAIMMFADLSAVNTSDMKRIVNIYRQVPDRGMLAIERIGLFRTELVEMIPVPDQNLIIVAATRGDPGGVERHLWKSLTDMHAEEKGYGMYTYVLFGRRLKSARGINAGTLARYESLLQAIYISTLSADEVKNHEKASTNILLIPVASEVGEPNRNNYNIQVSLKYLSFFSSRIKATAPKVSDRLSEKRAGPFLITTMQPIEDLDNNRLTMLYADLSTTNPAAMEEIVSAYKQKVEKGIGQIDSFRSLRLAILDLILDADDNIKIVQTAIAGQ